jgi:hypothetical protein
MLAGREGKTTTKDNNWRNNQQSKGTQQKTQNRSKNVGTDRNTPKNKYKYVQCSNFKSTTNTNSCFCWLRRNK